ncbi:AzlC family ABC transporter permease [Caryophanon latum]|uniref:Branched-chain amino acid ABC transporter permease n=1 Tax=Caryophanon latum TaxID=33977 RepID=A0A1C0YTE2_9BACL|nr:AzlC family ABC transporter permease [Caryophanon latum]OCS90423.1 branched-chain amino acid ABC transporter permease [Caryophanon latum]
MEQTVQTSDTFMQGVRDCIPTLLGYISIGLAFGVVGMASHLTVFEVFLLSALVYAGSAQFIFCGLYVAGAPMSVIIITVFVVNLRHLLMSLTVAPYLTHYSPLRSVGFGTLLTDETFGVAVTKLAKEKRLGGNWMDGLNVTAYVVWVASCTAGAVVGAYIPSAEQFGLDFALVAMFAALLVLNLQATKKEKLMHYVTLCGIVALLLYGLLYILPSHLAVLASTLIGATIGVMRDT